MTDSLASVLRTHNANPDILVGTTQVPSSLLPLADHRFCSKLRRRKQTELPNPGFCWVFIKNDHRFMTAVLYKLVSLLNPGYFDCILHETCTRNLCLMLTSSSFK